LGVKKIFIFAMCGAEEAEAKKNEDDWETAEKLYAECLAILNRYLDKNDDNIANVLMELTQCALTLGNIAKADEYSREYTLPFRVHIDGVVSDFSSHTTMLCRRAQMPCHKGTQLWSAE